MGHICIDPTLQEKASLDLATGESTASSGVIDITNGFAYFCTNTSPAKLVKIDLSNFTRVGAINLSKNNNDTMQIDEDNDFIYVGTGVAPASPVIIKVRISNFTEVSSVTLNSTNAVSSAIDIPNQILYVGYGGGVDKIALPGLTVLANLSVPQPVVMSIDTINNFLYTVDYTGLVNDPITIRKINLTSFSVVSTITYPTGHGSPRSSAIDSIDNVLYISTDNAPCIIERVDLNNFTLKTTLTLGTGDDKGSSNGMLIDSYNGWLFVKLRTITGNNPRIAKIDLINFVKDSHIVLSSGGNAANHSMAFDTVTGFIYTGGTENPEQIKKIAFCLGYALDPAEGGDRLRFIGARFKRFKFEGGGDLWFDNRRPPEIFDPTVNVRPHGKGKLWRYTKDWQKGK